MRVLDGEREQGLDLRNVMEEGVAIFLNNRSVEEGLQEGRRERGATGYGAFCQGGW